MNGASSSVSLRSVSLSVSITVYITCSAAARSHASPTGVPEQSSALDSNRARGDSRIGTVKKCDPAHAIISNPGGDADGSALPQVGCHSRP